MGGEHTLVQCASALLWLFGVLNQVRGENNVHVNDNDDNCKYEINRSPLHLIMSTAGTNLWDAVIFFLHFFLQLSQSQSVVYNAK